MSQRQAIKTPLAVLGVVAFAATDAVIKGHHGGTRNAVGDISATWVLLPFLAGTLFASRRGAFSAAIVGASSTVLALIVYAMMRAILYPHAGGDHGVPAILGNRWLLMGLGGGAVLGIVGARLATGRHWNVVAAVSASLLVLEPLARMLWALNRGENVRALLPSPSVWATEVGCGCLIVLVFVLARAITSRTQTD
jgi:Family of unknown function (DUF6518)